MKKMNKLLALVLAMVMVLGLAASAFAEGETYSITITNSNTNHTYVAYQIFTGKLETVDSASVLSDIEWGPGISEEGQAALYAKYEATTAAGVAEKLQGQSAREFAEEVVKYLGTSAGESTFATEKHTISNLSAGYYLVKDKNPVDGTNEAATSYIVQIVENTEVKVKAAKPTVDKQVHDETTDAEDGATNGWGETADHAINESFQFKLIANLPADTAYDFYKEYKVVFNDTMSDGITFESIDSVTVDDVVLTTEQYTKSEIVNGKWSLTITDVKAIEGVNLNNGAEIVVIYNAHLNESAFINTTTGDTTNKNTVDLQYSNNPNAGGEGDLGRTPEDHVWVFTYEVDNTKVDATDSEHKTPLAGAGFKLYDSTGTNEIGLIYDDSLNAYRPIKGAETAVEMKSADTTGKFNIVGLDAGEYVLKETTVPAGYNKCEDVNIKIDATHYEEGSAIAAKTELTTDSTMSNEIENRKGSTLPETGGIGTTIFYVLGGMLVVCAVVLMVSKKRMSAEG